MDSTASIVQFLQRPVKLDNFQLQPGNDSVKALKQFIVKSPQEPIRSWKLPQAVLDKGQKMQKVSNQYFFKADVRLKVVLNTNPFVAGRFYLTYSPYEDNVTKSRKQIYASRAGVTAYPGVEIDAQLNNTVEIVIPFASYKEAYLLNTKEPENFVTVNLFAICPILGAMTGPASSKIDFTVYAWFENVVINVPTSRALGLTEPQQVVNKPKVIEKENETESRLKQLKRTNPSAYKYIKSMLETVGRSKRNADEVDVTMQIQAENLQQGIVSDIANTIKGIAGAAEKTPIPIVKEVAGPVKWIASIVEGISNIFGWSRPNTEAQMCAFQNIPGRAYTHYSAIDQSVSLALQQDNELIKPMNVFPSGIDEMSLEYVCNNPAVKEVITWKAGTKDTLRVIPVGIGPFNRSDVEAKTYETKPFVANRFMRGAENIAKEAFRIRWHDGTEPAGFTENKDVNLKVKYKVGASLLDTAPCEYVSQLFQRWRATMCFKISVVKTAFHSGRLEIFFDPGPFYHKSGEVNPDPNQYTDVDTTNNYKYILDLTNDTEVTIRIPFVAESLYKSTIAANSRSSNLVGFSDAPKIQDIFDSMIGSLIIRPVSMLLAPETVAQEVNIIVWKWAEDVSLQIPQNSTQKDLIIYDPESGGEVPDPGLDINKLGLGVVSGAEYVQSPWQKKCWTNRFTSPDACFMIQGLEPCPVNVQMQINIGNIANKNVITFLNSNDFLSANLNSAALAMGENLVSLRPLLRIFRPWTIQKIDPQNPIFLDFQENTSGDNHHNTDFTSFLSYMYRFFRGGVRYKIFSQSDVDMGTQVMSNISFAEGPAVPTVGPTHMTYSALNPVHEVNVPFYCKYRKLPISLQEQGAMPITRFHSTKEQEIMIMRAGNDDLTFGWLMGTPQLTTGYATLDFISVEQLPETYNLELTSC